MGIAQRRIQHCSSEITLWAVGSPTFRIPDLPCYIRFLVCQPVLHGFNKVTHVYDLLHSGLSVLSVLSYLNIRFQCESSIFAGYQGRVWLQQRDTRTTYFISLLYQHHIIVCRQHSVTKVWCKNSYLPWCFYFRHDDSPDTPRCKNSVISSGHLSAMRGIL